MTGRDIDKLWGETLRSERPTRVQFDLLASGVVNAYDSGDFRFRQHIKNRFNRVSERTGQNLDPNNFDLAMAHAFIADEMGFTGWDELIAAVEDRPAAGKPLLFRYAIAAMEMGNFSALEAAVGGAERFDDQIRSWHESGYFGDEPETLAEVFAAACMLGYEKTAAYLLDNDVDPYAGMKTGLAGFHYAASSGRLDVIRLLIGRKVPMEIKNMYGGTVFDQAIWSAVNEYTRDHAAIVEALLEAGAVVETGYAEWWEEQDVSSDETKERISAALKRYGHT